MTDIRMDPIDDASAWRGAALEADRSWEYQLTDAHRGELDRALAAVKRDGLQLAEVTRAAFPLPTLGQTMARVGDDLKGGRGLALLHGFPTDGYDHGDLELLYWGLCAHVGTGITQNSQSGFIHYVTDGALRPQQGKRGVGFPKESVLHVDLTDIVSLLCVRQAPDDPHSRLASSTTLYNEVLRQHPEWLPRLHDGFEWDRMDEHGQDETGTSGYRVPLFSNAGGAVSCRYNRNWIASAFRRQETAMSAQDSEILDFLDAVAFETRLEFPFHQGDIQFCSNYTVLHGRAAHAVVAEEDRKRILMRIWLNVPEFRPYADEPIVRHGIVSHGQLGWTAADVLAGRNEAARARRADGAVALG